MRRTMLHKGKRMGEAAQFALAEGATLAHAFAGSLAKGSGIRVLSIKGDFAAKFGLREARVAADADLLIDPTDFETFCALLRSRGWHPRAGREPPTFMGMHSVTLIHDSWPCDIDVHSFFPGFLAAPQQVFECLWGGRVVRRIGNAEVLVPSVAGMTAILALHAERTPWEARSQRDLESIRMAIGERFTDATRGELRWITVEGRAQWVLRQLLGVASIPWQDDATPGEKRAWQRNRLETLDKSAALWLAEARRAATSLKPRLAMRALWVPAADIPRNDPSQRPTWKQAGEYNVTRWGRGARGLVSYVRRQLLRR